MLSQAEVERLLAAVVGLQHRLMLELLYAAGLRVSELTHLDLSDIDRERMVIHVRHGKGARDRYVMLAQRLLPNLDASMLVHASHPAPLRLVGQPWWGVRAQRAPML